MLLDRAQLLGLTASEMTVLVAGLRSLGISDNGHGVWTSTDKLSNEWLSKLLDMDVAWAQQMKICMRTDRASGENAHGDTG